MVLGDRHNFEWALAQIKRGHGVLRHGWNGKGMWVAIEAYPVDPRYTPFIYIEYPYGSLAYPAGARIPWLASQADILAEDWMLYYTRDELREPVGGSDGEGST